VTTALERMAQRYVWWTPPEKVISDDLDYLIAQVMDTGTWEDIGRVAELFGVDRFKDIYVSSHGRRLSPQSKSFWAVRLNLPCAPAFERSFGGVPDV